MPTKTQNETSITANLNLSIYGEPLAVSVNVPTGKTLPRKMLPVFRKVCGSIVEASVNHAVNAGRTVSCSAGCGACCRQMVPISPPEAIQLKRLFDALPEDRRAVIAERFEKAKVAMKAASLLDTLRSEEKPVGPAYKTLGLAYFEMKVACPFLENESCSIHPERPLVCREYLVVSPPENCARENGQSIEVIKIPREASKAVTSINGPKEFTNWIPLTLALEWAEKHPEIETPRPGPDIAAEFFDHLTDRYSLPK